MTRQFKIGDFLKRIKNQIDIDDSVKYKRVTVSGNHNGVSLRDEVLGSAIGTKKQFTIKGGNFILSKIDARNGAFGIIPEELDNAIITGNFWTYSVDTNLIDIEWFFYFTHSYNFIQICIESSTGSTHRKYMDEKVFLNHKIILPEIVEQKEMVRKYKTSSKVSNNLTSEIQTQKQLLTQLKQSILQEAIQGKLTADWRKQNPNTEPASELLKRIKAEKEQLIKDKKIRKEKALAPIKEEEIPFELPEGWVWCRLIDIGQPIIGLTYKPSDTSNAGTPVLRANNVVDGKIYMKDLVHVTFKVPANKVASAGDIIICVRSGSKRLIGKSALIDQDGLSFGAFMSLIKSSINPYLYHFLQSDCFKNQIDDEKSTGINQLTQGILKSIIIPVPPEKEQEVIIQQLQELSNKCSDLEKEITQSEKHAQILMQAILKEAFESKKEEAHA